eukprot:scaffold299119_cov32-Tisochrysis_lutea.AAC.2
MQGQRPHTRCPPIPRALLPPSLMVSAQARAALTCMFHLPYEAERRILEIFRLGGAGVHDRLDEPLDARLSMSNECIVV